MRTCASSILPSACGTHPKEIFAVEFFFASQTIWQGGWGHSPDEPLYLVLNSLQFLCSFWHRFRWLSTTQQTSALHWAVTSHCESTHNIKIGVIDWPIRQTWSNGGSCPGTAKRIKLQVYPNRWVLGVLFCCTQLILLSVVPNCYVCTNCLSVCTSSPLS